MVPPTSTFGWRSVLRWLFPATLLILISCGGGSDTAATLAELDGKPCPDSDFTCVTLEVPLDHFSLADGRTIPVTFAVFPSSGTPEGVFVTVVGGPGASGLAAADSRLLGLDPAIRKNFDIVFFDQRGVGVGEGLACPEADSAFTDSQDDLTESVQNDMAMRTHDYVEACVEEMDDSDILAYLGTIQAVQDLEVFRQAMGYGKLVIKGESYGTAFAQVYATEHPNSVERLVFDGTVDATRDILELTSGQIEAFDRVLQMIFDVCDQDHDCSSDMGMPAEKAWRNLNKQLTEEPAEVRYPTGTGEWDEFSFTAEDLGFLTFTSIYNKQERMLLLRGLAAHASRGDLVPLIRLHYIGYGDGISSNVYESVTCLDTSYPGDNPTEEIAAISTAMETSSSTHLWLYDSAATCPFWPNVDHTQGPSEPFIGEGIPTLVISAQADPTTPHTGAVHVAENLDQGYLLTVTGGFHGMFGWGNPCIDKAVTAFILDGTMPDTPTCDAEVINPYFGLFPESSDGYETAELLAMADGDLYSLPELVGWDRVEEKVVGCSAGGQITFTGTETSDRFEFEECGLAKDFVITGNGQWDYDNGISSLKVSIEGHTCSYTYSKQWEDGKETADEAC